MQPGGVITPGSQPEQQSSAPQAPAAAPVPQPASPAPPSEPVQQPAPAPEETSSVPENPEPQPEAETETDAAAQGTWQFNAEEDDYAGSQGHRAPAVVTWTASEYIAHDKNTGWYALVVLGSVVLAAIVYLIVRDFVSPVIIIVLGIAFAAFGARKPQVLEYVIDNSSVRIGDKRYSYELFRTFSIIVEDATRSILLMPTKRYNLPITIYYEPKDEEKIVEALGSYLPHEDRIPSLIDNFMRKIRF